MLAWQHRPTTADPPDFDAFYRREHAGLVRLAHLLTGLPGVAEELAQEALLAVHQRWSDLDNPGGYARRALVNMTRSHHRRRMREDRHQRAERPGVALPPEVDSMWAAICDLPSRQRDVIVLRFYEDLSLSDIADILDRPLGTVKSSLHRALARLKEVV